MFVVQAVKDTSASGFSNHNRKDFFEFKGEKSCLGDFCMNPVCLLTLLFWKTLLECYLTLHWLLFLILREVGNL